MLYQLSYNTLNYSHNPNYIKNNKYQSINILDILGEKLKRHQKNRNLTPSHRSLEAVRYATLRDLGIDRVYDHYYVCIQLQLANTTSKQYISSHIKNFPVVVKLLLQKEKSDSGCDTQVDRFTSQHHSRTTSDGRSGGGGRCRRRR